MDNLSKQVAPRVAFQFNLSVLNKHSVVLKAISVLFTLAFSTSSTYAMDDYFAPASAGASITTGDDNTLVGVNAGNAITAGSNNTMIGKNAGGLLNDNDSDNTFIGAYSGQSNTGTDNTFVGKYSGFANTTATDNTFIGTDTGLSNTTGFDNTFVGEEAGRNNTTGRDNTFIGEDSGFNSSTGRGNTAIGSSSLHSIGISLHNTAIGNEAGWDLGSSSTTEIAARNTLLGVAAGLDIGIGIGNTMLGANAGQNTEHGDLNTFVGVLSGHDNNRTNSTTNSNRNTALGAYTAYFNREGSDNVSIGSFAGSNDATGSDYNGLFTTLSSTAAWFPSGTEPVNVGYSWIANRAVRIGGFASSNKDDTVAVGYHAKSTGLNSISMGSGATASHLNSIAIGFGAASHANNTVTLGNASTASIDANSDAVTSLGSLAYRYTNLFSQAASIHAASAGSASIQLWADGGAQDDDKWNINAADSGNFSITSSATAAEVSLLTITNTGDMTVSGDITINSDERLKQNIEPLTDALALVNQLDGKVYHWRPELGRDVRRKVGFIAQEVESVLPDLITENKEGFKSVNYQGVVPVLVNAVKELSQQAKNQSEQIKLLQQQIELQQQLLSKLNLER